jgi:hypothetical protein
MTEPMTDERLEAIAKVPYGEMPLITDRFLRNWVKDTLELLEECVNETRRLREDNAEQRAINDQDYKSIQTLRGEIKNLRQELVKFHGMVDLALDCWGPVEKRPRTDFVLRSKAFMKALRKLDEEDR